MWEMYKEDNLEGVLWGGWRMNARMGGPEREGQATAAAPARSPEPDYGSAASPRLRSTPACPATLPAQIASVPGHPRRYQLAAVPLAATSTRSVSPVRLSRCSI